MKTNLRIGEVLMERNYITQEQMEQALAYQKEHREKRVGQILIELGFVTEAQVLGIVSLVSQQPPATFTRSSWLASNSYSIQQRLSVGDITGLSW